MLNNSANTRPLSFLAVILFVTSSTAAHAGILGGALSAGSIVKLDYTASTLGGASGGGEFALFKEVSSGVWEQLGVPTFCLEFNEYVSLKERLVVGAISDRSVAGGVGGALANGDPLSPATQYLYASYATDALASQVASYTRNDSWANAMQQAIWYLEDELGAGVVLSSQTQALVDFALSYAAYKGPALGTVAVLNLFAAEAPIADFVPSDSTTWGPVNSYRRQDQIFYIPPPPVLALASAPEPASGAIWLTAVGLLAIRIRARRENV